jgi:hypothetical protein
MRVIDEFSKTPGYVSASAREKWTAALQEVYKLFEKATPKNEVAFFGDSTTAGRQIEIYLADRWMCASQD